MKYDFLERVELAGLKSHWMDWSQERRALVGRLILADQGHLFSDWEPSGVSDELKEALLVKLEGVERNYPGGLCGYVENSRRLLKEARSGENPFEGSANDVPISTISRAIEIDLREILGESRDRIPSASPAVDGVQM